MKTPISYLSVNSTGEVGRTDDYLTGIRVVPVRQEGNVIYGRSLVEASGTPAPASTPVPAKP
jgi:hypothetical protein